MKIQEWLMASNLWDMLEIVDDKRKKILFAIACCRSTWHLMIDKRSCEAIELAEQLVDNQPPPSNLDKIRQAADDASYNFENTNCQVYYAAYAAHTIICATVQPEIYNGPFNISNIDGAIIASIRIIYSPNILCEILRNIYHPSPPNILTNPNIVNLATVAYNDFTCLPILADAIEEINGPNEASDHLRTPGPHYRGWWSLDLLLTKPPVP
jgi:hypothetical protein